MPNWLAEFLAILSTSPKTQWAIILGAVFFLGINLTGEYWVSNLDLQGQPEAIENVITKKLLKRYDKAAFISLASFWVLAFRCYQKDKKRFWQRF